MRAISEGNSNFSAGNTNASTKRSTNLYTNYKCRTYAYKEHVPPSDETLFTTDFIYPDKIVPSKRFFRLNHINMFHHIRQLPYEKRTFYEYIEGSCRKPYFDIEYEFTDEERTIAIVNFTEIKNKVLQGIQSEFESKSVPYSQDRDCIILQSHGTNKFSLHIIINNFYFDRCNKKETSNVYHFAKAVLNNVPKELRTFTDARGVHQTVDMSVYSSGKEFRLIWNTKIGQQRYLNVDSSTSEKATNIRLFGDTDMSEELQLLRLFEACLITRTNDCILLPDWVSVDNSIQSKVIILDDKQKMYMIDVFNTSSYSDIWRIDEYRTSSKNSLYLIPINKPFHCPCHDRQHDSNNAALNMSENGNINIKCFAAGGKVIFIGKDDTEISDDDSVDEINDEINDTDKELYIGGILMKKDLNYVEPKKPVKSIKVSNNQTHSQQFASYRTAANNQLINYQQNINYQRVPAMPIINNIIPPTNNLTSIINPTHNNLINNDMHDEINTLKQSVSDNVNDVTVSTTIKIHRKSTTMDNYINNNSLEKLKEVSTVVNGHRMHNEGQQMIPSNETCIELFLMGNNKYRCGCEYSVLQLFDSYNNYRNNQGVEYSYEGGVFSKALIALGHSIIRKRVNGNRIQMVTLKSTIITNTNPVEKLQELQQQITSNPLIVANPSNEMIPLNQHIHIPQFMAEYFVQDPEGRLDLENTYLSFVDYCKRKRIQLIRFKHGRFIQYFKKWIFTDVDGLIIKGWKCREDKENDNNREKEASFRRIFNYNTAPYMIGYHNGPDIERYDQRYKPNWRNIDVHHYNDEQTKNVNQLIEMTHDFNNNLPDNVKDIKRQILDLRIHRFNMILNGQSENLKSLTANALIDGIIQEGSDDHIRLLSEINRLREEGLRINNEEIDRLESSIIDDIDIARDNTSWCIALRSTFGTGKTVNLKPYILAHTTIEENPNPSPDFTQRVEAPDPNIDNRIYKGMRVLIVLPRITLTDDYMAEYRELGFKIYTEMKQKEEIRGNRVIVCYPSLCRVRGEFDLLILDEYKILKDLQHTLVSKTSRKSSRRKTKERSCYEALKQYVSGTKRVYIADGLLTNAHVLEIQRMRKISIYSDRLMVYQNLYQKHRGKEIWTVDDKYILTNKIIQFLRQGNRVVVPTNSKAFADYLYKQVMDLELNIPISISTGEQRASGPIRDLWNNKQLIIYTPTILAGNSYTDEINVVCGYFTTSSCDQADAMQMLMRSRNNTSKKYYICVEKGPGAQIIPSHVDLSTNSIKQYLMDMSKDARNKNVMNGWPEEYHIPIDMIRYDYISDEIKVDDIYFNSYVNFIKQCAIKQKEYLFRMLLYMRDCGFHYGGNIYTTIDDKASVGIIKCTKKIYNKEKREENLRLQSTAKGITEKEYALLNTKSIKTLDEKRMIKKYRLKRCFKVNNTPKWFLTAVNGKYQQYSNIKRFRELNGIGNQICRYNMMGEIGNKYINENNEEEDYDVIDDIKDTNKAMTIKLCFHALNILKMIGAETFIRSISVFGTVSDEFRSAHLISYGSTNEKELRDLVKDYNSDIIKLLPKVTNKAFGIKFMVDGNRYIVDNTWILNSKDVIWPMQSGEEVLEDYVDVFKIIEQDGISNKVSVNVLQWLEIKYEAYKKVIEDEKSKNPEIKQRIRMIENIINENQEMINETVQGIS